METHFYTGLFQKGCQDDVTHYSGDVRPDIVVALILEAILENETLPETLLFEASVPLPRRGRVWVASFTDASGSQTWRTTGLTDRQEALALAKKWEAEAATQRTVLGTKEPSLRFRRWAGGLTQREVGLRLGMSERGVRVVERRALQKLYDNRERRKLWRKFLTGELHEVDANFNPAEAAALLDLTRTPDEYELIKKIQGLS